jgi:hypothetical protein
MIDNCPDLWDVLHDAIVVQIGGTVPGDLTLELDCDYLRDRFPSSGDRFVLTLRNCTRFAFTPWAEGSSAIEDLAALAARRLWILSAEAREHSYKVHCSEDVRGGNGGELEVAAFKAELRLDNGALVTPDELKRVATEYWEEFRSRSQRS